MSLRTRTKVLCFCKKCNGSLVDPRTKSKHMSIYTHKENNPDNNYQDAGPSNVEPTTAYDNNEMDLDVKPITAYDNNEMDLDPLTDITDPLPDESKYHFLTKKLPEKSQRGKKGKISDIVLDNILLDDESDKNEDDDSHDQDRDASEEEEVNFPSKEFDDGEAKLPNINSNYKFTWVILWILQYQQQYKLSNVAVDSLFKFLRFFLLTIDDNEFLTFPSSLYIAKNMLGITTKIIKYGVCNKCHKL